MKKFSFFSFLAFMSLTIFELKAPHRRNPETRKLKRQAQAQAKAAAQASLAIHADAQKLNNTVPTILEHSVDQQKEREAESILPIASSSILIRDKKNDTRKKTVTFQSEKETKETKEKKEHEKVTIFYEEWPSGKKKLTNLSTKTTLTFMHDIGNSFREFIVDISIIKNDKMKCYEAVIMMDALLEISHKTEGRIEKPYQGNFYFKRRS